jgi:hypothetical protein
MNPSIQRRIELLMKSVSESKKICQSFLKSSYIQKGLSTCEDYDNI